MLLLPLAFSGIIPTFIQSWSPNEGDEKRWANAQKPQAFMPETLRLRFSPYGCIIAQGFRSCLARWSAGSPSMKGILGKVGTNVSHISLRGNSLEEPW